MVLTDLVRGGDEKDKDPIRVRRRALLALGAVLVAGAGTSGCGLLDNEPAEPPPPDPLQPLADDAVRLAGLYGAAATAFPERAAVLTPIAAAHEAHAKELARIMATAAPSPAASASASAGTEEEAVEELRVAEKAAYESAVQACLRTPTHRAALVGSIAAARATHLEALK